MELAGGPDTGRAGGLSTGDEVSRVVADLHDGAAEEHLGGCEIVSTERRERVGRRLDGGGGVAPGVRVDDFDSVAKCLLGGAAG